MKIDVNKSRVHDNETEREKALRERVEKLEARLAKLEPKEEQAPEPKKP